MHTYVPRVARHARHQINALSTIFTRIVRALVNVDLTVSSNVARMATTLHSPLMHGLFIQLFSLTILLISVDSVEVVLMRKDEDDGHL